MSHTTPAPSGGFAPLNPPPVATPVAPVETPNAPYATHRRLLPDSQAFVNEFTRPLPDPHTTFSGPGYYSPRTPACGFATAALLLSLLGVVLAVPALVAIIFGHIGVHRTRDFRRTGRGMAIGGTVLGYAVALFWAVLISTTWIADL